MASNKKAKISVAEKEEKEWVFEDKILEDCSLKKRFPDHYVSIESILKKEGFKGKCSLGKQKALCLDPIEIELAKTEKREQRSTTDMAIGVVRKKGKSDKRIRLVECKFDVNKVHNKLIEDLKEKDKDTRDYYSFGCAIQKLFVVLLNDGFYHQGFRFIKNGFLNSLDCEVLTARGFCDKYFN